MRGEAIYYLYLEVKGHMRLFLQVCNWDIKEESRGKQEQHRSKKSENEQKNGSMDVRMLELSFIFTIANESVIVADYRSRLDYLC